MEKFFPPPPPPPVEIRLPTIPELVERIDQIKALMAGGPPTPERVRVVNAAVQEACFVGIEVIARTILQYQQEELDS
jgi:hypothetical protein